MALTRTALFLLYPADFFWTICGSHVDDHCSRTPSLRHRNDLHRVRCCSENPFGTLNSVLNEGCSVYGASHLGESNTCFSGKTHAEAEQICSDNGGRLCTRDEVEADCTAFSGCGFNHDVVWTSTSAAVEEEPLLLVDLGDMPILIAGEGLGR